MRRRRWELAAFAAVVAVVALAVAWGWDTTPVPIVAKGLGVEVGAGGGHLSRRKRDRGIRAGCGSRRCGTARGGMGIARGLWPSSTWPARWRVPSWNPGRRHPRCDGPGDPNGLREQRLRAACVVGRSGTTTITGPRGLDRCGSSVAFDTRRRRLVIAAGYGFGIINLHARRRVGRVVGRRLNPPAKARPVVALTYSADHDCLYGVVALRGSTRRPSSGSRRMAKRNGGYRCSSRSRTAGPGMRRQSFQLVASGPLLALVRSDDFFRLGLPPQSQLTLIDPTAGQIVYRGILTPHTIAATTAPATPAPTRAE